MDIKPPNPLQNTQIAASAQRENNRDQLVHRLIELAENDQITAPQLVEFLGNVPEWPFTPEAIQSARFVRD